MWKGRWWMGVSAGVALGLGGIVAVEASTGEADAQRPIAVTAQQLKINQRISQAAVKRSNDALTRIGPLEAAVPLYAVSNGAVGVNLVRGRGAVTSQRVDEGNYRVKFDRNISACSWTGIPAVDAPPVPDAVSVRIALDTTDAARTQVVVRTSGPNGQPLNSAFHVQVLC
jgi:cytochrome c oxidase assembly protein Cox11